MKPKRTGSYPYLYIAQDFGLPYWVVLCYADAVKLGASITHKHWIDQYEMLIQQGLLWAARAGTFARSRLGLQEDRHRFHDAIEAQGLFHDRVA